MVSIVMHAHASMGKSSIVDGGTPTFVVYSNSETTL
jgi:hypothetical protein